MKIIAILLAALLLPFRPAQGDAGNTGAVLLREPFGARAFALGQAYAALGDDVFGLAYNPAILSRLSESQAATQFVQSLGTTKLGYLGLASPLSPRQSIGLSVAYLDAGKDDFFDANGVKTGSLSVERDFAAQFGYARSLDLSSSRLHLGVGAKLLRSVLVEQEQATAYAADVGALYEFTLADGLASLAAAVSNLGPGIRYSGGLAGGSASDPLPLTSRAGVGYARPVFNADGISFGAQIDRVAYDDKLFESFGLEYDYRRLCALRVGYRAGQDLGGFSMGVGVNLKGLSLDYGLGLMQRLNNIHQVSLTYRFTAPGIRYGKPFMLKESPVEALAARVSEKIAAGLYFDAAVENARLETAFPGAARSVQLRVEIDQRVDALFSDGIRSPRYRYAAAFKAFQAGSWDEAIQNLEAGLREEPSNAELRRALEQSRRRRAEAERVRKLEQQARNASLFELANIAFEEGDHERALKIVNTILSFGPYQPAESLRSKIESTGQSRRRPAPKPKPAIAPSRPPQEPAQSKNIPPPAPAPSPEDIERSEQLYSEAMNLYLQGNIEGARTALTTAARLNPESGSIHNFLSSVEKAYQRSKPRENQPRP